MASNLARLGSLAAIAFLASACASSSSAKDDVTDATTQDLSLRSLRLVGSLDYGQTSAPVHYARPRYTAFKFAGQSGDDVDVWVRSPNGDPVAWVLDDGFKVVAMNDDASTTDTSSHIKVKLPANASATHYVVVRDYWRAPMSFTVELQGGADFVSGCNVDADCVKVSKVCCSELGQWTAVRAGQESAYQASLACATPLICPKIATRLDDQTAECNRGTHKCELVLPKDVACGGFIAPAMQHECPTGYSCRHLEAGLHPDMPGHCYQFCGGFAGFACHDPAASCVDDPSDSCDPTNGGADCGGICVP
jgi:hypothetical protein